MTTEPREWDLNAEFEETRAFIQWKGTDVCLDFHCKCGAYAHFDGFFAYAFRCSKCNMVWEMPNNLFPRAVTDPVMIRQLIVKELESEDDD
jgi:hypothetical protein